MKEDRKIVPLVLATSQYSLKC